MNNVHEDAPEVFETRWAMSYLRGPLTRAQIKQLMAGRQPAPARPADAEPRRPPPAPRRAPGRPRGAAGPPARRGPALRAGPRKHARRRHAGLPAHGPGRGDRPLRGHEDRCRPDRRGRRRDSDHGRGGAHDVGGRDDPRRPRRRPQGNPGARGNWTPSRRPPRSPRLRGLEPRPRGVALRAAAARAPAGPGVGRGLEARRERARLPRADPRARAPSGTSTWRPSARSTRRSGRRSKSASGAPSRRRPRESRAGHAAWRAGRDLPRRHDPRRVLGRKTISATNIGRATTAARDAGRVLKEREDVARAQETVARRPAGAGRARDGTPERDGRDRGARGDGAARGRGGPPKKTDVPVRLCALAWAPYWRDARAR